jgi:N-acetylneuraminic acid mutarotase
MPVALFEAAAAGTTNGKIYVFGGEPSTALGTSTSGTWIYDIATNTWSTGANMPLGVQQHSAITGADGRIYIIGGGHYHPKSQWISADI